MENVDQVLADAAKASEGKKVRKPKQDTPVKAKEPKAPREKKEATSRIALTVGGESVTLKSVEDTATIAMVGEIKAREGSKRAERAKAFENGITVAEFFKRGGASKDLIRHMRSGVVELYVGSEKVAAV